jgi:pentatricopeptide repeat protein
LCKYEIEKALNFLDVIFFKGRETNVVTYNIFIFRLCRKGETEKAIEFLNVMISEGHNPDIVTYNTFLDGLCKKGEIHMAMDFFDVMISIVLQPDVVTYNILKSGLKKNGKYEIELDFRDYLISKGLDPLASYKSSRDLSDNFEVLIMHVCFCCQLWSLLNEEMQLFSLHLSKKRKKKTVRTLEFQSELKPNT